jgi:hypothetical protein
MGHNQTFLTWLVVAQLALRLAEKKTTYILSLSAGATDAPTAPAYANLAAPYDSRP